MTRHRLLLLLTPVAALLAALLVPAPAQAATKIGGTLVPNAGMACNGSPDFEIFQTGREDGTSYAVPKAGVVTSWSFQASLTPTTLTMRVFRSTVIGGAYYVVADAGPLQTVPGDAQLHTYPTRVPVQPGDFIGVRSTDGLCVTDVDQSTLDSFYYRAGTAAAPGSAEDFGPFQSVGYRVDLAAALEPDADGDGYGDESQDQCPTIAATTGPCLPDTAITKKPSKHAHGPASKLRFSSSIAGSTYSCTLDKKKAKACASPAKYRCLKVGRHTFSVAAVSPFGTVDPAPATTTFKVSRQRHGC